MDGEGQGWLRETGRVLASWEMAPGHVRLDVRAPGLAGRARPGQFAMVRARSPAEGRPVPFLGRPLSFFHIDPQGGVVSFLVREAGEGTRLVAARRPGDTLFLLGPFGNGFPPVGGDTVLVVAGGVGVAPFPPVVRAAVAAGARVVAVLGARSGSLLVGARELADAGAQVLVCTEDGSLGVRGTVIDGLARVRDGLGAGWSTGDAVRGQAFACGPPAMLLAVAQLLGEGGFDLWLSLEARMGCGFGVCRGCAIPAVGGGYRHVCQDGPVFAARDVDLEGVARLWAPAGGDGYARG